jgi:hypothetical protein
MHKHPVSSRASFCKRKFAGSRRSQTWLSRGAQEALGRARPTSSVDPRDVWATGPATRARRLEDKPRGSFGRSKYRRMASREAGVGGTAPWGDCGYDLWLARGLHQSGGFADAALVGTARGKSRPLTSVKRGSSSN